MSLEALFAQIYYVGFIEISGASGLCSQTTGLYSEETEEGYTGGYTPAFTLRGLFMQLLSFFSSEEVSGAVIAINRYTFGLHCN